MWEFFLYIYGVIAPISILVSIGLFLDKRLKEGEWVWNYIVVGMLAALLAPLAVVVAIVAGRYLLASYIRGVRNDGGLISHIRKVRMYDKKAKEYRTARKAYENGELRRDEVPRVLDGERHFELHGKWFGDRSSWREWKDLIYVENRYCKPLNDFFRRHPDIELLDGIRVVYLPQCLQILNKGEVIEYWDPSHANHFGIPNIETKDILLSELCYPEDFKKIRHGLMSCFGSYSSLAEMFFLLNGSYYELEIGNDEYILAQIERIAQELYQSNNCGLPKIEERPLPEDNPTDDTADEQFSWEIKNLLEEVRERVDKLEQRGLSRKLLLKYIMGEPQLSRLVVTKDHRIVLPDYQNMEISMEPINKAVYLLFLRHPEGIIFKYLPDYRRELMEIYQKLRPLGLNERAIHSIEDVTNPCLNSINEKCARIRGAFVSMFDEHLARHYYIYGLRGEAKKIDLPRDLVIWE